MIRGAAHLLRSQRKPKCIYRKHQRCQLNQIATDQIKRENKRLNTRSCWLQYSSWTLDTTTKWNSKEWNSMALMPIGSDWRFKIAFVVVQIQSTLHRTVFRALCDPIGGATLKTVEPVEGRLYLGTKSLAVSFWQVYPAFESCHGHYFLGCHDANGLYDILSLLWTELIQHGFPTRMDRNPVKLWFKGNLSTLR